MDIIRKKSKSSSSINETQPNLVPTKNVISNGRASQSSSTLSNSAQNKAEKQTMYEQYSILNFDNVNTDTIRHIELNEALGLDFNSFLPGNNKTQIHFISNVQSSSAPYQAGLRDGDRILTVNGFDVTHCTHEDVRSMILDKSTIKLTVMNDSKYLTLIEKIKSSQNKTVLGSANYETIDQSETQGTIILLFSDSQGSVYAKHCIIQKEPQDNTLGFLLRYTSGLHMIDGVKFNFPAYNSGIRSGDVILFIEKRSAEQMTHDDVKLIIQTLTSSNQIIDLIVINKNDMQRYKEYGGKDSIDWQTILSYNSENNTTEQQTEQLYSSLDHRPSMVQAEILANSLVGSSRVCTLELSNGGPAGFAINNTGSPPFIICKIDRNSPADKAGLRLNDKILSINGKSLMETNYKDAVQIMKEALEQKIARIIVSQQSISKPNEKKKKRISFSSSSSENSNLLIAESKVQNPNTINAVEEYQRQRTKELSYTLRLCHLHAKNAEEKLSITFGFEISEDPDYEYPVISHVEPKSPGERAGIQVQDILLRVNDRKTKGLSFEKVKKVIEKGKQDGRLEILVVDKEVYNYCKKAHKKFKQPDIKVKHIFPKTRTSTSFLRLPSVGTIPSLPSQDNSEQVNQTVSTFNVHRLSIPKDAESDHEDDDKISSNLQSKVDADIPATNYLSDTVNASTLNETPLMSLDSVLNSLQQMSASSTDLNSLNKQRKPSQSSADQSVKDFISKTINNIFQHIGNQKLTQPDYDVPVELTNNVTIQTPLLSTAAHNKNLSKEIQYTSPPCDAISTNQSNVSYDYIREPRRCVLKLERNKGLGFILSATNDYDHIITAVEKNSAADIAGLQINDEIIEIDQHLVVDMLIAAMHTHETLELCVVNSRSNDPDLASIGINKKMNSDNLSNISAKNQNNNNNNNNNNHVMNTTHTIPSLNKDNIINRLNSLSQEMMNKTYANLANQSKIFNNCTDRNHFASLSTLSMGITASPKDSWITKSSSMRLSNAPSARLCRIREFQSSSFYGLFLCGSPKKLGRVSISEVRKNSSAALCGLRDGDQIIEVNGTNIQELTYETILDMIKRHMELHDLELLVLDKKSFRWYRQRNYPMTLHTLPTVVQIEPIIHNHNLNSEIKSLQTFNTNTENSVSIDHQSSATNL